MRKIILHIVLLSYTVFMLKPVLPYVSDCINHVFFYAQHMATVHYENGKYHVHYETAKDAKEETSDKTSSSSKKDNTANEHVLIALREHDLGNYKDVDYILLPTPSLINGTLKNNYPPPRI